MSVINIGAIPLPGLLYARIPYRWYLRGTVTERLWHEIHERWRTGQSINLTDRQWEIELRKTPPKSGQENYHCCRGAIGKALRQLERIGWIQRFRQFGGRIIKMALGFKEKAKAPAKPRPKSRWHTAAKQPADSKAADPPRPPAADPPAATPDQPDQAELDPAELKAELDRINREHVLPRLTGHRPPLRNVVRPPVEPGTPTGNRTEPRG